MAAIFCSEDGAPPKQEFVVKCRDGNRFQFLSDTNPNVDLSYPLLFPQAEKGFQLDTPHELEHATAVRNRVTM